tara:strand:+ start:212 stop:895 length:684 start_codon:yes stop_codon:yes gene_type:complete
MSKVYTDNVEKRTGGAAIAVPASGQWIDLASAAQGDVLYHNGTSYVRLAPGTAGQVLQTQGAGANPVWAADAGGLFASYALIADQKTQNTAGGTFTKDAWRTRDLNTEITDPDGIVSISANEFTLAAGSYLIKWSAPAHMVEENQTRLFDVTGAALVAFGSSAYTYVNHPTYTYEGPSSGFARVAPSGSNVYRIEHYGYYTTSTNGFGVASNIGTEQYTMVEIFKES